jgi:hypothetical protein
MINHEVCSDEDETVFFSFGSLLFHIDGAGTGAVTVG